MFFSCSLEVAFVPHFFLHRHCFTDIRNSLFDELQSVDKNILSLSDHKTAERLLYGSSKLKLRQN